MRILIVATSFPPDPSPSGLRPYFWAKYWVRLGHEVTVLTAHLHHEGQTPLALPETGCRLLEVRRSRLMKWLRKAPLHRQGAKQFLFAPLLYLIDRRGILSSSRMPDPADLWVRPALEIARKHGPWDAVVSTAGPYATHVVAHTLKSEGLARRWIADYRHLWIGDHLLPGLFPFTLIEQRLEHFLMQRADVMTAVSLQQKEKIGERHGKERVHIIADGYDQEELDALDPSSIFLQDDKLRIVCVATRGGEQHMLPLLLRTVSRLMQKEPLLTERLELILKFKKWLAVTR
jgi:hypothetical protein